MANIPTGGGTGDYDAGSRMWKDIQGAREAFPSAVKSFFDFSQGDRSPDSPSQAALMADPTLAKAHEQKVLQQLVSQQRAGGSAGGGTGGGGSNVSTSSAAGGSSAVDALSAARQPRGTAFSNLFGSTVWNPETGQFDTTESEQFQQFQTGLMGQLVGAQQEYADFDPQAYAQTYIDAVTQPRDVQRAEQEQTALSRMIAGGKLGASSQARAMEQLASQQKLEDVQTQFMGQQYGAQEEQRLLGNIGTMFGTAGNVAAQQFAPQQAALSAVPIGQEIMSFPEEPQFQWETFQQQLAAQKAANSAQTSAGLFGAIIPHLFG